MNRPSHPPVVSVVITCYNQASFLGEAIESALAQTYHQCEIVVVDDGSTDNTAQVAARHAPVRYLWQTNQGLSAARNTGIRASHGRYLVFLDADDRLLPDAVQVSLDSLQAHPECAFVYGHHRYITSDGVLLSEYPPDLLDDDPYLALLKRNVIGMHATVVYPRTTFERVGAFQTSLSACEDYDLYLRIARRFPISQHTRVVAEYRFHSENMSHDAARMLKSALSVLRSQRDAIRDKPRYLVACAAGARFWRHYFGGRISTRFRASVASHQWRQATELAPMLARFSQQWLRSLAMEVELRITAARLALTVDHHPPAPPNAGVPDYERTRT